MSDHDRCFYVFTLSEGEVVACNNIRKDHNTFTFGNQPQHPFAGPPASDAALVALSDDGYKEEYGALADAVVLAFESVFDLDALPEFDTKGPDEMVYMYASLDMLVEAALNAPAAAVCDVVGETYCAWRCNSPKEAHPYIGHEFEAAGGARDDD